MPPGAAARHLALAGLAWATLMTAGCDAHSAARIPRLRWTPTHGGFFALNSLRMEKGYRHWGHDIGEEDTPYDGGVGFEHVAPGTDFGNHNVLGGKSAFDRFDAFGFIRLSRRTGRQVAGMEAGHRVQGKTRGPTQT